MKPPVTWVTLREFYTTLERLRLVLNICNENMASPERQHVEEQALAFEKELHTAIDNMTVAMLKEGHRKTLWHKKAS